MSTDTDGSQIAGLTFNAEDVVIYDPILQTATLVFDGSTIFDADTADVDAVYVEYNNSYDVNDWDIIVSTSDDADISAVTYDDNDLISYDVSAGTASLLVDGASNDVFNGDNGDIDAAYIRYDDPDEYILSTDDTSATIGISGTQDTLTHDDLVELNLGTPTMSVANNVFLGDTPNGVFTPSSGTRKLNGVHVIEDGYFGHFAIIPMDGDTCSATSITIRKHVGLSHVIDTNYEGSIQISNNILQGTWAKDASANGAITDLGSGAAEYTFTAADNGEVILYLTQTTATVGVNVDVTNGISEEDDLEDADFDIDDVVTLATYRDEFSSVAFNNNDGSAAWDTNWVESNDDGSAGSGDIVISGGKITFTDPGGNNPSISRDVDFSSYNTGSVTLNFDWETSNVSPGESFEVYANDGGGATLLTTISTVGIDSGSESINVPLSTTGTITFSFVVAGGYTLESISLDNIEVATSTTDCGVGNVLDHYAITNTGPAILCLATPITISGHSLSESLVAPQAPYNTITLSTGGTGTWVGVQSGSGTLVDTTPGDGMATYTFNGLETTATLWFINDGQSQPTATVNINVSDTLHTEASGAGHDDPLIVNNIGIRFFNLSKEDETMPTLVSGKSSDQPAITAINDVISIQAYQTIDYDTTQCMPLFDDGATPVFEFAAECIDPVNCAGQEVSINGIPVSTENSTPVTYDNVTVPFTNDTGGGGINSYIGGILDINYPDAGEMRLYARYTIPGTSSTNALTDFTPQFVVRPFGYSIDFNGDRVGGLVNAADSYADNANVAPSFQQAGVNFDAQIRAVVWEMADDADDDGVPDTNANLTDNNATPNYGNEQNPNADEIVLSHTLVLPSPGNAGVLSVAQPDLNQFSVGEATATISFNEVGIIEITADLDPAESPSGYLDGNESIIGVAPNVGRFTPAYYDLDLGVSAITERPNFPGPLTPTFTYMGEEFEVTMALEARNNAGDITQNYAGNFAKLTDANVDQFTFYALEDIGGGQPDVDWNSRISIVPATFPSDFQSGWGTGTVTITGHLIFSREIASGNPGGEEEAPLTDVTIAFKAQDTDGIEELPDVNIDDGTGEGTNFTYHFIDTNNYRYGRMRLENAYGSELKELDDLNVPIGEDVLMKVVTEYWDGTQFVLNTEDGGTTYSSMYLSPVAGSYLDDLADGEFSITTVNGTIYQGASDDELGTDIPFAFEAPGEGVDPDTNQGSVIMEYDLDSAGLGFLRYDWRTPPELDDETQDDDFTDFPRAILDFGSFQSHQRIINWQELFIENP